MLLPPERLDLGAGGDELGLELTVAVAQRLEIVVQLAQRQAEFGQRELDILAPVATPEPPIPEGGR